MALFSAKSGRERRRSRRVSAATSSLSVGWDRDLQQTAGEPGAQPQSRIRILTLAACAALLIWLVVEHSLALYLADAAPKAALWLSPGQPESLVNLADQSLNANTSGAAFAGQEPQSQDTAGSPTAGNQAADAAGQASAAGDDASTNKAGPDTGPKKIGSAFEALPQNQNVDLASIRAEAQAALTSDPLNPRALRILGQAADTAGNDQDSMKFMRAAAQLSMHETIANFWLMRKSTEAGDYEAALRYADALLRTNSAIGPYVVPVLAHFADSRPSIDSVEALVDANPPWRHKFFAFLPRGVSDVRTPLAILLSLKATPTPPDAEELGDYLSYLIEHKFYNLAYYAWLQFLSPDALQHVGLLYNGDFSDTPSGLPFDWDINQGSGVSIDIVPQPGTTAEHALSIDFLYGRVEYHSVNELVLLAPGTYQFEGKYQGELIGPRGLKWRVACAEARFAPITESQMIGGVTSNWQDIKFTFTIPEKNCAAQYISLDLDARMASEQLVTGSMMFADLNISRAADAASSEGLDSDASDSEKSDE